MLVKLILLSTFAFTAQTIPKSPCNRLKINSTWYDKEVILPNVGRPYHLAVHKATNTLFFSYSSPDTYADIDFQLAYLDLDTKDHEIIAGIRGGCSVAIDQGNDDIYLGGSDGIYKYNMHTKLADFYKEKDKNIWALYFKDNLFYISYPDQKLYIDVDGKFIKVSEFERFEVDSFYVAANHDVYFANKTGFYKLDGAKAIVDSVSDVLNVRQIVEDNDGAIYVCTGDGIYIRNDDDEFVKIVDLKSVFGLAFDKDNSLIYSDEKNIVKLKMSKVGCKDEQHW